ncbi:UNVERIFIED_CONTAM: ttgR [Trichonephila clavipes]|uniref:DNA-binding transcriptional repressor n=2 Tax=Ectopseudomonas TaxID=3236654 RepID=A0A653B188_ECTOL|nr:MULTISPECIES: TetR family transcriptional regulator [Pseudomonas]CAE6954860.1 DNA-binding transcriptional repressor AcrR [Pseudomonas oleovorans]QFT23819.1 HTH-type transcriptional regulator TtgR [Pseudomonas sp. THAF187a]QFT44007.1 HTH-type transcriptional regulator TtgR [Pseudomonas sp. THAF42]QTS85698.1 TetR family transcriptional regulator [Pseudomonas khazarica]WFC63993.1 TetR family transcriptional regulator [Pseudomonas sp. REST10]|tara:strand:- start:47634 stop:48263 length:630 start_codon:yes stop_codon:yes gene_type:complete
MARRTKEEAQATRVQILDAAERVFHAQGVSRASLAEVAKEAGVSRGAIYWHFENKIDLFQAMLERLRLPLEELARATESEDEPDPLGCMRELLIKALTRLAEDEQTRRAHDILRYKCEYTGELVDLRERLQALSIECDQRIAKALSNAVNKGQLPEDLDCERAAVCLHAYMEGIEANWLLVPNFDLVVQAPALIDTLMHMLLSPALRRS